MICIENDSHTFRLKPWGEPHDNLTAHSQAGGEDGADVVDFRAVGLSHTTVNRRRERDSDSTQVRYRVFRNTYTTHVHVYTCITSMHEDAHHEIIRLTCRTPNKFGPP